MKKQQQLITEKVHSLTTRIDNFTLRYSIWGHFRMHIYIVVCIIVYMYPGYSATSDMLM